MDLYKYWVCRYECSANLPLVELGSFSIWEIFCVFVSLVCVFTIFIIMVYSGDSSDELYVPGESEDESDTSHTGESISDSAYFKK